MHLISIYRKQILVICLIFTLICSTCVACSREKNFEDFTYSLFIDEITSNTLNLHYTIENPNAYGIDTYTISLSDFSNKTRAQSTSEIEMILNTLHTYPYLSLSREEKLTYDVLEDYLNTQISLSEYALYEEPLSGAGGLQMQLPILFAEYEFNCEQDVKDYLDLLALVDAYYRSLLTFEKEKISAGLFMSDSICKEVIKSCESFLENQDNHYLATTFEHRLEQLDLSTKRKETYLAQNKTILQKEVFPAYENLISTLRAWLGSGHNELGLCYLPNGTDYYELLVYAYTGSSDSLDQMYRKIELQRTKDLIASTHLQSQDATLLQQCAFLEWEMEDNESMLDALKVQSLSVFPNAPELYCDIRYVEPALEDYLAPAFYIVAPIDNYLDNDIYINSAYVTTDLYGFTTIAHEGYPGHLYQTVMSYEYCLPEVRSILDYPGYVEGWATYVEMMAFDYAGLDSNLSSMLSLNQSATLSLYASSDIGLHYYGWTSDDMCAFWSGYGISDIDTINEITQLILSEPGNYLKYYIGYLEFLALQDYAKEQLGDAFSLKEFHRTVLDIGPAPFPLLEKYFLEYYSPQT